MTSDLLWGNIGSMFFFSPFNMFRVILFLPGFPPQSSPSHIKIGDKVRVKPTVTTPKYKWGSVTHRSVGVVKGKTIISAFKQLHQCAENPLFSVLMERNGLFLAFSANGKDVIVDFPQQSHWTGLLSEMELVPSVHPGVRYGYVKGFSLLSYSVDASQHATQTQALYCL